MTTYCKAFWNLAATETSCLSEELYWLIDIKTFPAPFGLFSFTKHLFLSFFWSKKYILVTTSFLSELEDLVQCLFSQLQLLNNILS